MPSRMPTTVANRNAGGDLVALHDKWSRRLIGGVVELERAVESSLAVTTRAGWGPTGLRIFVLSFVHGVVFR